jgi:hypothetical protein
LSIKQAAVELALAGQTLLSPPRLPNVVAYPLFGYVLAYMISAVLIVRIEPTADASLAAMRDRSKFGMAIAAMIKMIATTIRSSIREKPFCLDMSPLAQIILAVLVSAL